MPEGQQVNEAPWNEPVQEAFPPEPAAGPAPARTAELTAELEMLRRDYAALQEKYRQEKAQQRVRLLAERLTAMDVLPEALPLLLRETEDPAADAGEEARRLQRSFPSLFGREEIRWSPAPAGTPLLTGSAGNAPGGSGAGFTRDAVAAMTEREIMDGWQEIRAFLSGNE